MLATQDLNISCVNAYTGLFPQGYLELFNSASLADLSTWYHLNRSAGEKVQVINQFTTPIEEVKFGKLFLKAEQLPLVLDKNVNGILTPHFGAQQDAEEFIWIKFKDGKSVFQTVEGNFMCADASNMNTVFVNRENALDWENFVVESLGENVFALKASTGMYLHFDKVQNKIIANANYVSDNEKFFFAENPVKIQSP